MYQKVIEQELKANQITVRSYSSSSCGCAFVKQRQVKIPKATNLDRCAVCLHEIAHVIKGHSSWGRKLKFIQEFEADQYEEQRIVELGLVNESNQSEFHLVKKRNVWHTASRLAMAHNRGLSHDKIPDALVNYLFLNFIDINDWKGRKVFVGISDKSWTIKVTLGESLARRFNKEDIERCLTQKGLLLSKSEIDDSTYGQWSVRGKPHELPVVFESLSSIVNHYSLSL